MADTLTEVTTAPTAFTCILSYPENPTHWTDWHPTSPTGTFSKLQRGHFPSEQEAHDWAESKGIHPDTYEVRLVA